MQQNQHAQDVFQDAEAPGWHQMLQLRVPFLRDPATEAAPAATLLKNEENRLLPGWFRESHCAPSLQSSYVDRRCTAPINTPVLGGAIGEVTNLTLPEWRQNSNHDNHTSSGNQQTPQGCQEAMQSTDPLQCPIYPTTDARHGGLPNKPFKVCASQAKATVQSLDPLQLAPLSFKTTSGNSTLTDDPDKLKFKTASANSTLTDDPDKLHANILPAMTPHSGTFPSKSPKDTSPNPIPYLNNPNSILGPHPSTIQNIPFRSLTPPSHSYPPSKPQIKHKTAPSKVRMDSLSHEDELLIQKFIGLHTGENRGPVVQLPESAASSNNWECTVIAKVITNRLVQDAAFTTNMVKAWNTDPSTTFRPLGDSAFLIEFASEKDMQHAWWGGPWTFRGDLVALKKVNSHLSIDPQLITTAQVWVQFFNAPLNLTDEGIAVMADPVGRPVSPPFEGFVAGRRFVKIKMEIDLNKPLKDRVSITHSLLGEVTIHSCYEKISRVCMFCGMLGHEHASYPDSLRLAQVAHKRAQEANITMAQLLKPTQGVWIINSALVPKPTMISAQHNPKRAFPETGPNPTSEENGSGVGCELPITISNEGIKRYHSKNSGFPSIKRPRPAGYDTPAQDI